MGCKGGGAGDGGRDMERVRGRCKIGGFSVSLVSVLRKGLDIRALKERNVNLLSDNHGGTEEKL